MSDEVLPAGPTREAFEAYLNTPLVQAALILAKGTIGVDLLRDCFTAGASYAVARCQADHHVGEPTAYEWGALLDFGPVGHSIQEWPLDLQRPAKQAFARLARQKGFAITQVWSLCWIDGDGQVRVEARTTRFSRGSIQAVGNKLAPVQ